MTRGQRQWQNAERLQSLIFMQVVPGLASLHCMYAHALVRIGVFSDQADDEGRYASGTPAAGGSSDEFSSGDAHGTQFCCGYQRRRMFACVALSQDSPSKCGLCSSVPALCQHMY